MIDIPVVTLLCVEAARGIDAGLVQALADVLDLGAGHSADVVQVISVILFQHLHDVRELLFAGEVEVYFQHLSVGVGHDTPHAMHVQAFSIQ